MNSLSFYPPNQPLLKSTNKTLFSSINFNATNLRVSSWPRNLAAKASARAAVTTAPEKETLYDLLGIPEDGTLSDIKSAYKKMALKYHPDVSPPDRAEEYTVRFIRVQEAYETLSDPEARSMYDSCMAKGFGFSGKRDLKTRFDPRSDDKKRWREMWNGQISELQRRRTANPNPNRADRAKGMSWGARIRNQRSKLWVSGSDPAQ
ncbi:hypothetical protein SSX86_004306 [Deinandra increscens subsp. villosa]|uniref:J domain-containing protein n=1 Tax=Deinandra increscens subsp. villosa TaxID=3103831 RepID=A0AAP0H8Q5_9ASTR